MKWILWTFAAILLGGIAGTAAAVFAFCAGDGPEFPC